jgi:phage tail protein X
MNQLTYRTKEGDMVDEIAFLYYGSETMTLEILKANPFLSDYSDILPAGLLLALPVATPAPVVSTIELWSAL